MRKLYNKLQLMLNSGEGKNEIKATLMSSTAINDGFRMALVSAQYSFPEIKGSCRRLFAANNQAIGEWKEIIADNMTRMLLEGNEEKFLKTGGEFLLIGNYNDNDNDCCCRIL